MATKSNKEIRVLPIRLEARAAEGDEGKRTIAGSILYNQESHTLRDWWGDQFVEELAAGCFDDSLKTRGVVGLWSHDMAQVLGNTKAGTLRLVSNEASLNFDLDLPNTQAGNDAWESIQRQDVDGVSFGMIVLKDKWSKQDDIYKRTILDAELYEISPVAFAAYPANEISCRSLEKFKEELRMAKEVENKETKKESLEEIIKRIEKELEGVDNKPEDVRSIPAAAINTNDNKLARRAAFNHYLRTGERRDGTPDPVDPMMVSGNGGMVAPDDFAQEIIDGLNDDVVMRQLARILPAISGKSAIYPRRTGGSGAAMVGEGEPIVPYDLTFDQVILTPKKAAAIIEVSNELLADAGIDLAGYLAQHFRDEIAELLEDQYLNGDAADANLQGILTAEDGEENPLIERVPTDDTTVTVDDVLTLWGSLPAKYRKNAAFVCNSTMETVLRGLQDGNGQYLMVRDLTSAMGNTLLGRPLVITDAFPGDLTAGDDALMVGDFSKAIYIADKQGIDIQRNDAMGFNKDTTAFRAIFRTDVALALPEALKVLTIKTEGD